MSNLSKVTSTEQFQELLSADLKRVSIINFWTPWAEPCHAMNDVVKELAKTYPAALFLQVCNLINCSYLRIMINYRYNQVEAEEQSDIAESFDIEAVPTFLILQVCTFVCLRKSYGLKYPVRHRVILSWIAYLVPTLLNLHKPWLSMRHPRLTLHFHGQTNLQQRRPMWFHRRSRITKRRKRPTN
jgi:thiol-disulfide isomerase/thioredoxin